MKILKVKISLLLAVAITVGCLHIQSKTNEINNLKYKISTYEQVTTQMLGAPIKNLNSIAVTVTSYNPTKRQCGNNKMLGANDELVTPGVLAISRDLATKYGLKFGDKVMLEGYGMFTVGDYMHPRFTKRVDILSLIPGWSNKFGLKRNILLYFSDKNTKF